MAFGLTKDLQDANTRAGGCGKTNERFIRKGHLQLRLYLRRKDLNLALRMIKAIEEKGLKLMKMTPLANGNVNEVVLMKLHCHGRYVRSTTGIACRILGRKFSTIVDLKQ
jgi:hypothetical protein